MTSPETIRLAALAAALRQASIFNGLSESDLLQIAGYSERRSLAKDEILFEEGQPVKGFYVVLKGLIKAYRVDESGREQVIHLIPAGQSFAEPAVAGLPGYPAHTRALEKSEVVLIRGPEFLAHLQVHSELALRMLASLSRHLHELVHTIESYRLQDAEKRLLHWLLHRCPPENGPASIRLTTSKGVLASELGTRQETLSRLFSKLRKAGILKVQGRNLTIENPGELRELFEASFQSYPENDES
ncbi:MAG TPA: Crp/Fnr family transcriptional regulator [Luteolibacter sp.]